MRERYGAGLPDQRRDRRRAVPHRRARADRADLQVEAGAVQRRRAATGDGARHRARRRSCCSTAEQHMRMRKLMLPPFHGEAIAHYAELIEQITNREIDTWRPGQTDPHAHGRAADHDGGDHPGGLRHHRPRAHRGAPARPAAAVVPEPAAAARPEGPRTAQPLGPLPPPARPRRPARSTRRSRERRDDPDRDDRKDILTLLLSARDEAGEPLTDRELRDELITLLLAGHETTATSIGWAFERLLRTPAALERLTAEIDAGRVRRLPRCRDQGDAQGPASRARGVPRADGAHRARRLPVRAGHAARGLDPARPVRPASCTRPTRRRSAPSASSTARRSPIPGSRSAAACAAASGAAFATLEMKVVISTILARTRLRAPRAKNETARFRGVTLLPSRGGEAIIEEHGRLT